MSFHRSPSDEGHLSLEGAGFGTPYSPRTIRSVSHSTHNASATATGNHANSNGVVQPCNNDTNSNHLSIAVIGSGIAGLSAAWLLSKPERDAVSVAEESTTECDGPTKSTKPRNRVKLYERAHSLGMDAEALDTDITYRQDGETRTERVRLDMPLRVFTEAYYTHLTKLYDTVGVEYQSEDYSGSFSSFPSSLDGGETLSNDGENFFGYTNWLIGSYSFPVLFNPLWSSLFSRASWVILKDLIRFHYHAKASLSQWSKLPSTQTEWKNQTMRQWKDEKGFSQEFLTKMFLPTMAGILTCTHASVLGYPAHIILSYWCKRSLGGVRRVCAGTQQVVRDLTKDVEVKLATSVVRIERVPCSSNGSSTNSREKVRVVDSRGGSEIFDHVVIACQANHAALMLKDAIDPELLSALRGITYEQSRLITHSDPRLMPADRAAWNSVNFILPPSSTTPNSPSKSAPVSPISPAAASSSSSSTVPASASDPSMLAASAAAVDPSVAYSVPASVSRISDEGMATIWLNRAQTSLRRLGPHATPIFQSWNPLTGVLPRKELTLHDVTVERPVVTPDSVRCVETVARFQGRHSIWFVGSYATVGMPLLETAVASAVRVSNSLGQQCPWTEANSVHPAPSQPKRSSSKVFGHFVRFLAAAGFLAAVASIRATHRKTVV